MKLFFSFQSSRSGGSSIRFLVQKESDDVFSPRTLDAHIRFKLSSSKPVSSFYYPNLPFHVTLDGSPHQIQPIPYKNCFKKISLSLRGFVRTQRTLPGSAPVLSILQIARCRPIVIAEWWKWTKTTRLIAETVRIRRLVMLRHDIHTTLMKYCNIDINCKNRESYDIV